MLTRLPAFLKNSIAQARLLWRGSWHKTQKNLDLKLVSRLAPQKIPSWRQFKHLGKFLTPTEKKLLTAFLIIVIASVVSLAGEWALKHRQSVPTTGGEYTEGLVGFPSAINPLFAPLNSVDADLSRLIYAGLLKYDGKLNLTPDLAEKYSLDNSGKIYSLTLRKDLRWPNNEPITSDDAAFTFNMIQNVETKSPLLVSFQNVKFNKIDDLNFTLELEQPFAPFIHLLTTGVLPAHLWQDVAPANLKLSSINLKPMGAGPFSFASLSKDSRGNLKSYTLKPNPNYHLKKPYLKQIIFKFFPDINTAMEALRNRQVRGLGFLPKEQKEKLAKKNLNPLSLRLPQYTALFFNQKVNLLLKSAALRQALAATVDRNQIIKQSLGGEGVPASGPIPPGNLGLIVQTQTGQNLESANQILDKDGWKKISRVEFIDKRRAELYNTWLEQQKAQNPEFFKKKKLTPEEEEKFKKDKEAFLAQTQKDLEAGLNPAQTFFREKNGFGLTLTLTVLNLPEFQKTADLLKGWWQELGAQTNVNLVEAGQAREIITDRSYEVLLYGVITGAEADPYPLWHSSQISNPGLNLAGYANRQADEILEKARQTQNPAERAKLYQQFQKMLAADLPAVFLYHATYLYPIDRAVKGVELFRIFQPADRFNDIVNWYLNAKSQWR